MHAHMNSTTTPIRSLLLAVALALVTSPHAYAVSGVAVDATAVDATAADVVPGLTLQEALATPLSEIDAAAGRALSRRETRAVKRAKRSARRAAYVAGADDATTFAIVALATGAGGILVLFVVPILGLLACATGIVFGAIAMSRTKRGAAGNRGFAIAGFVCGIVGVALALF